jgi:hypothetical protein
MGEGYVSQKKIAEMLDIHHETAKRILHDGLNMHKVLHALDGSQKVVRVQASRELLDFIETRTDRSFVECLH